MTRPASRFALAIWTLVALSPALTAAKRPELVPAEDFTVFVVGPEASRKKVLRAVEKGWSPAYAPLLVETLVFTRDPGTRDQVLEVLETKTGQRFGADSARWYEWVWRQPESQLHPDYATFKKSLYSRIDPRFAEYFDVARPATIRLDEVRWGGVRQDGIPPLRDPKMIGVEQATYLDDGNVVFGVEVEGQARAYPKRVLAWHEMFTDEIAGVPVAGVYCTLCGTVILYETRAGGTDHELGTSGFLYRSNKLMYDRATQSLWNTFSGEPVVGPLVDEGIRLPRRAVVTTTWGEWRRRHPETLVLSLDTGHRRNYGEGVAYRDYFATDELMFNVPFVDDRLDNKDEVLALIFDGTDVPPLAIAADFLAETPVYHDRAASIDLVVLTDASGANRVYKSAGVRFAGWDQDRIVHDTDGGTWKVEEHRLVASDGRTLDRFPAQRAFWFGLYAAYPGTRLVRAATDPAP